MLKEPRFAGIGVAGPENAQKCCGIIIQPTDSGLEKSVNPRFLVSDVFLYPYSIALTGVENETLKSYGQTFIKIAVSGLLRDFQEEN